MRQRGRAQIEAPKAMKPKEQKHETTVQQRQYQLITPLFGGGAEPGEADAVTVVRGTEIRGHLRFWWRATRGGQFSDLSKMKEAEDRLWGAAASQAEEAPQHDQTVQISVTVLHPGRAVSPFTIENRRGRNTPRAAAGIPAYAAFPLQPDKDELAKRDPQVKPVREGVMFTLTIAYPADQKAEIEAALWAWETFGGLGARTRRGLGALHLLKIDDRDNHDLPHSNQTAVVEAWIREKLARHLAPGETPENIAHLQLDLQFKAVRQANTAKEAWRGLLTALSHFRQVPDGRSGRSLWPEPEAIRNITRRRFYKYSPLPHPHKFPRAAFGAPIVFHFKDNGDPEDTSLQGAQAGKDRLSSPLILRPLLCDDGRAVGLAAILAGPRIPPGGFQLVEKGGRSHPVETQLTASEASTIPALNNEPDVLQAFLHYLGGK